MSTEKLSDTNRDKANTTVAFKPPTVYGGGFGTLQAAVPLVLLPQENRICLVDTGAECTMVTEHATKRINKGRIDKSGPKTLLTVGGKETVLETRTLNTNLTNININILVLNVPYLLHVGAVPVDPILGQDWLKANCPVSFDLVNGALLLRQIQGLDVPIPAVGVTCNVEMCQWELNEASGCEIRFYRRKYLTAGGTLMN
jgi:hypothetical protein